MMTAPGSGVGEEGMSWTKLSEVCGHEQLEKKCDTGGKQVLTGGLHMVGPHSTFYAVFGETLAIPGIRHQLHPTLSLSCILQGFTINLSLLVKVKEYDPSLAGSEWGSLKEVIVKIRVSVRLRARACDRMNVRLWSVGNELKVTVTALSSNST